MKEPYRRVYLLMACIVMAMACAFSTLRAQTNVTIAPTPSWVKPVEWTPDSPRPQNTQSEGVRYLLDERQDNPQRQEEFVRIVSVMENETGVQDSGNLSFYFDPSYQELILHKVEIHRGNHVLNRLDRSKIKTIQPEPDLDGDMLTGEHTALVFVEDLRVGDVLEYSYTTKGFNPILGGHYSPRFGVQFGSALDRQHIRVLWPSDKPLQVRTHLTEASPAKKIAEKVTEYSWDFTNIAAIDVEDHLPANFEAYPYVELSDYPNWASVVDWALPLYAITNHDLPPELETLIAKWKETGKSDEERALLALEFVQDKLRYTALELGPDSYQPAPPAETFQKRFGDCKGKVLLLCAIYRAMNFEAWPALVNSYRRDAIANRLPSPFAFDHVIVQLNLAGKTFWLDPTISHQGGALKDRFHSRFGKALVIRPGETQLADVPSQPAALQSVSSIFRLTDYESPALLTVRTTYRGDAADDLRQQLARTVSKDFTKTYLNYYARFYPDIESTQPLAIKDDRTNNILLVTEDYRIKNLWTTNATTGKCEFEFYGDNLSSILTDPKTRLRKLPLRIPYPLRREHDIAIHLPDVNWNISDEEKLLADDAFTFHYHRKFSRNLLQYHFDCETRVAELPAQKVAVYLNHLDEMEREIGATLFRPPKEAENVLSKVNWLMVVIAVFAVLFTIAAVCLILWLSWRRSAGENQPPLISDHPELRGLGGWLTLVGLGLCLGPLIRGAQLLMNWKGYFSMHVWQAVALPQGSSYHPLYAPLLIFELLGNIALIGINLLAACFFFGQRKTFPKAYILLLWSSAILLLIDELVGGQIPLTHASHGTTTQATIRSVLAAMVWTAYTLQSRRVKATFVK